jgi:hypothetical protein
MRHNTDLAVTKLNGNTDKFGAASDKHIQRIMLCSQNLNYHYHGQVCISITYGLNAIQKLPEGFKMEKSQLAGTATAGPEHLKTPCQPSLYHLSLCSSCPLFPYTSSPSLQQALNKEHTYWYGT